MIHVVPLNDEKEHDDSSSCWCRATVEWEHAEPLCIHNASDCREIVEQAEDILSNKQISNPHQPNQL
jgi:hypothetical protein